MDRWNSNLRSGELASTGVTEAALRFAPCVSVPFEFLQTVVDFVPGSLGSDPCVVGRRKWRIPLQRTHAQIKARRIALRLDEYRRATDSAEYPVVCFRGCVHLEIGFAPHISKLRSLDSREGRESRPVQTSALGTVAMAEILYIPINLKLNSSALATSLDHGFIAGVAASRETTGCTGHRWFLRRPSHRPVRLRMHRLRRPGKRTGQQFPPASRACQVESCG